ncbi:MAG: response regulator, partial [Acidobacteria bacterium]|nr:response regulator [Acidobacteriota bacterium]
YLEFNNFNNLFGTVITTRKPVLSNDCQNDSRSGGIPAGHPPLHSFLGVPVIEESQVIGMIGVANRPGGYTASDQEQLQVLAQTAGVLFDGYRRLQHQESLEAQLRQAQKMEAVGRLSGGIAHDFNNLLTVIKGYSQMLTDSPIPDTMTQPLQEIQKAVDRAVSLTRQLLAFSRRQVLQPKVFDVNLLIQDVGPMVQRLIGEDIELRSICEAIPATIKADLGQIEQVLMNLAVNARDAMPQGGQLIIRTATVQLSDKDTRTRTGLLPGRFVLISVADTGCGMDASVMAHIFEPFFTTKEAGKGTGLGLSTVYGIIHQSGGTVDVKSRNGSGTTFNIYLPLSLETPETEPVIEASLPVAAARTILLVEDDPMVRELTSTMLGRSGYEVLQASNCTEALEHCRVFSRPIHLVLTDVIMPGPSGPETVLRLKSMRPGMKTLFMSGYIGDTIAQHGLGAPGISFLEKPFTPAFLNQKVAEVLRTAPDTIVVADDDESILQLIATALEIAGFRVLSASNGVEALKLLHETRCLLLITDLEMPYKDGIDLAIEVQREFPDLPILVISGANNLKAISFATELKDVQLLQKPFDKEQLLTLVGQLV